jgi:hypothetical protein
VVFVALKVGVVVEIVIVVQVVVPVIVGDGWTRGFVRPPLTRAMRST